MWYGSVIALAATFLMPAAQAADFVLITQELDVQEVSLVSLDDQRIVYNGPGDRPVAVPLQQVIALAAVDPDVSRPDAGVVELSDGQRLPGGASDEEADDDVLPWRHPWLGRIDVPLDDIAAVRFLSGAALPPAGEEDVVLLANGDTLEGFIVAIGDPIELEVGTGDEMRIIDIPLQQVASLRLVSPTRAGTGARLWLTDGTVLDVQHLEIESSGRARVLSSWHSPGESRPARLMLIEIAAILLDSNRLVPLAALEPQWVEGPSTRYEVPPPRVLDDSAVLGMSPIEFRGPLVVRYMLPAGVTRFAAQAVLPSVSRSWGDYELIVRDQQGEIFRDRLSADNPEVSINVPLTGRELEIELTEGSYGSIQDHLLLQRPMLLVDGEE